jgi:prenyltransferase beta subunit
MLCNMSAGGDPTETEVAGEETNLVSELTGLQDASGCFGSPSDMLNNTIWAVIALDMYRQNYPDSPDGAYDEGAAAAYIESKQKPNGGFDEWNSGSEDAASTADALIAIASNVDLNPKSSRMRLLTCKNCNQIPADV